MMILIFTRNGNKPPRFPQRPRLEFRHIDFNTDDLDDLLLIAKFRIINYPTSIIIDDRGRILLKVKGSIPDSYLDSLLNGHGE